MGIQQMESTFHSGPSDFFLQSSRQAPRIGHHHKVVKSTAILTQYIE